MGLTITIGTKNYKVIFANANLTKDGLATNVYDYGDYFAWGATEPWYSSINKSTTPWTVTWKDDKTDGYAWSTVPYRDGSNDFCNKYTLGNTLEMKDDAANNVLGGDWQIPTKEIWVNLNDGGTHFAWTWENVSGYNGYKVKSNLTNEFIFLPGAGRFENKLYSGINSGYYWSNTAVPDNMHATYLFFDSSANIKPLNQVRRFFGLTVRPVRLVSAY